jgi:hypothetical protein
MRTARVYQEKPIMNRFIAIAAYASREIPLSLVYDKDADSTRSVYAAPVISNTNSTNRGVCRYAPYRRANRKLEM